jgi:16S rRNA (cytosine967-C5)-methyltransferase
MPTSTTPKLPVRQLALEILCRVETTGAFADHLISHLASTRGLSDQARGFLRELTYGVLRWRNRLDWLLGQCSTRPLDTLTPRVRNLLRIGAYQVSMMERIPVYAAVSETVHLAKQVEHAGVAAFVNAVLRAVTRQQAVLSPPSEAADISAYLTITQSHPRWLVERWLGRYGPQRTVEMCQANNRLPPFVVRVNRQRTTRARLIEALSAAGCQAEPCRFAPEGVLLRSHPPLGQLEGYQRGWFSVQDEAAMLCAYLLAPRPGERVLDACAAPGGKATHLGELMGDQGQVLCLDQSPRRLRLVEENRARLGLKSLVSAAGDATTAVFEQPFDRILVDAPCSGFGVLRRHPDAKWRKGAEFVEAMSRQQITILNWLSRFLKPAGLLVYVTCSTELEENQAVVHAFLRHHPTFALEALHAILPPAAQDFVHDQYWFQTWPGVENLDGFFGVRLRHLGRQAGSSGHAPTSPASDSGTNIP